MTAEQLEELASEVIYSMLAGDEVRSIARRLIAAERMAKAGVKQVDAMEAYMNGRSGDSRGDLALVSLIADKELREAITAYREASK